MRKNRVISEKNEFRILTLDDDEIMTVTLQSYFQSTGFHVDVENDPLVAIERIRNNHYDILLLDFLMRPICGDVVVSRIREFNKDLFIILLTGHRSLAPPVKTIRDLSIQGYYEKSDRFDQLELLVESCVKSIRQMRTIYRYRDGLGQILDTIPELYKHQQTDDILGAILNNAIDSLDGDDGFIYLDKKAAQNNAEDAGAAGDERFFKGVGEYADWELFAVERFLGLAHWEEHVGILRETIDGGERVLAPLFNERNKAFGIICIDWVGIAEDERIQLFEIYAKQASAALNSALLDALVQTKNEELNKAYASLNDNYLEMIDTMRFIVDAKDIYTRGHSDRVSFYAMTAAKKMNMSKEFVSRVELAGLFHDIGKIGTPESILLKDSKLTDEEYEIIKQHPKRGAKILSALSAFEGITQIIEHHHERVDGRGYPNHALGDSIPMESRIISVADAFDAMTTDRQYRHRLPLEKAVEQLVLGKGTQFDARVVDAFLEMIGDYESIQSQIAWTYTDMQANGKRT
jgi:putative nucleotidyltransferase with HDIG domain